MKGILPRHNKAVSELISYTLLIVVAVIASTLVYNFRKLYTSVLAITATTISSV